jgi:hypothetical protein
MAEEAIGASTGIAAKRAPIVDSRRLGRVVLVGNAAMIGEMRSAGLSC